MSIKNSIFALMSEDRLRSHLFSFDTFYKNFKRFIITLLLQRVQNIKY